MRSYIRRWHKFASSLYTPLEGQKGPKKSSHYYIFTWNPEVKVTQNLLQKKISNSLMNATEQSYLIFHNDCYNVDLSERVHQWAWNELLFGYWPWMEFNDLVTGEITSAHLIRHHLSLYLRTWISVLSLQMSQCLKPVSHTHISSLALNFPLGWMRVVLLPISKDYCAGESPMHSARHTGSCCCLVAKSCLILLWPHGLEPTRLFHPQDFPREECWSGSPFPSPGDCPDPGIESTSPALEGGFFTSEPQGSPRKYSVGDEYQGNFSLTTHLICSLVSGQG